MEVDRHREVHDNLLKARAKDPNIKDARHDESKCPFCLTQGGTVQYSDEEVAKLVADATAQLSARIQELESAAQSSEIDARVAAVHEEDAKIIEDLRTQLDLAVLAKEKVASDFESFKAEIEQVEADKIATAALLAKREERLKIVREVTSFSEDRLQANADRYAAMEDDDFESIVEDYRAVTGKKTPVSDKLPNRTALVASRDLGVDDDDRDGFKTYRAVMQKTLQDRRNHPRNF